MSDETQVEQQAPPQAVEAADEVVHKSLALAVHGVMKDVSYVQKIKTPGLNYTFLAEADIVGALHGAFVKHGLIILPVEVEIVLHDAYTTTKGASMNRVVVKPAWELVHVHSGEKRVLKSLGCGADVGDKDLPKSLTGAYKYVLRQAFLLETGNDPDYDSSEDQEKRAEQRGGQARPAAQPARRQPAQAAKPMSQKTPAERFELAKKAVAAAPSEQKLNDYRVAYTSKDMNLSPEQVKTLDGMGEIRRKQLLEPAL